MKKKIDFLKKMKVLLFSAGLGLSLTACSNQTNNEKCENVRYIDMDREYDIENLCFLYKDGELSLTKTHPDLLYLNILHFNNFYTRENEGNFQTNSDVISGYNYSDDSNICIYQAIPLNRIVDSKFISGKTLNEMKDNMDYMETYLDENYNYNVVSSVLNEDKTYYNCLSIYTFSNELDGTENYYIGYNASRLNNSQYIYDICTKKVYRMPDIGIVDSLAIKDIYDSDVITVNDAKKLLEEYILKTEDKTYSYK